MIKRLDTFLEDAEESLRFASPWNPERKALNRRLEEADPIVREILNTVRSGLGNYKRTTASGWSTAKTAAQAAIGILKEQDELVIRLTPDTPSITASGLHQWVWDAAQSFWESDHYSTAVEQAWKSINARLQAKTARRDLSDDDLINQTLSLANPKPGETKVRVRGDRSTPTWISKQRGLHTLGQACAAGIRNVLTHEHGAELSEQIALEYLATLSVLARWIDDADTEPTA